MFIVNIFLLLSALTGFFLGLFILISNPKKMVNRMLAAFQLSVFLWLSMNLLANLFEEPEVSLFFARLTLVGATLLPLFFIFFVKAYTAQDFTKKNIILVSIVPLAILGTTLSSLNIVSVGPYGQNTVTGVIYYLLTPYILTYCTWGFLRLKKYYATASSVKRTQTIYIFTGMILTLVPSILANAILPSLGYNEAILYGPSSVILLAVFMTIAIVKHQLLDIRSLVARSLAYILLFVTVVGLYGVLTFSITRTIFGESQIAELSASVTGTVLLLFTLQPLRNIFARLTNRFFYQDAYDSQLFLNDINKILVGQIQLETLLEGINNVIQTNLKPDFSSFIIRETAYEKDRIVGTGEALEKDTLAELRRLAPNISQKIVLVDDLGEHKDELGPVLDKLGIAVLIRLVSSAAIKSEGMGYLVLGYKKSGSVYSAQDMQVLEILSNEMVIAIENALRYEEIQKFADTLQRKVDDATAELKRANQKLKQLDETKDEFISMASHQLRTPLTSVKGYLSMVLEGDAGQVTDMQKKLLDQAFVSSQRMVYLIADLLNLSRLKTGKFIIDAVPTDLAKIVQDEVGQLLDTAASRGLKLEYSRPLVFPKLMLDETKIRQVMMNFIDNAIYYTKSGGTIVVGLKDIGQSIEFTVKDDGIGISKPEQAKLFTKFFRASNAKQARPDGTGLGLFMVRKVIVAQGGSIVFQSKVNEGSTFGFRFEKAKLKIPETKEEKPINI